MIQDVLIVGGGTAGWLTAAYLARVLSAPGGAGLRIRLVESEDIGIIGVGEGTFPSIRKTLRRLGIAESKLITQCDATFKQGVRFTNWRGIAPGRASDHYIHPFQAASQTSGLNLLPYWLLGLEPNCTWAEVASVQTRVADAHLAPKLIDHEDYAAPLNYAYHFDATKLAKLLQETAIAAGVTRLADTIDSVTLTLDGAIASLVARQAGELTADLYIDCTGFRAQLIGGTLKMPFTSIRGQLFANRALAMQVPYDFADGPIASYTVSTAHEAGWTWDIGLPNRRGIGYVYSSDHTSDARAEEVLRGYIGASAEGLSARTLTFEPGYRRTQWHKNCIAIGLSAGFIEPLEATGIGFAEIAALILTNRFPWAGDMEACARQFNRLMAARFAHVADFIKLHYALSHRSDSVFWRDNIASSSVSDSLLDRLDMWRYRPPDFMDVDVNVDTFTDTNWQYVLYGMGFKTDISAQRSAYRFFEEARAEFADIRRQGDYAVTLMPKHRDLISQIHRNGFSRGRAA